MTPITGLLVAFLTLWVTLESYLEYFYRSPTNATKKDGGSSKKFNLIIFLSISIWVCMAATGFKHSPHVSMYMPTIGCLLLAAGLSLRLYAITTLRKFFTVDLAIQSEHKLIKHGPYRMIRHPSYTGAILCFSGLSLSFGYWASAIIIVFPVFSVYIWRIIKEERILMDAFGAAYKEYCLHTYRLIPGII
jgi:protein-S-isoprenylcysteine O-methyltransferase